MTERRIMDILATGLKAGFNKLMMGRVRQRPEYPRDYMKLYSTLEDSLFELCAHIERESPKGIYEEAGNVISIASMLAEMAEKEEWL